MTEENKELQQQVQTEAPQDEQPMQPARAKLDFAPDERVEDSKDELEQKLLQLDSQGTEPELPEVSTAEAEPQPDNSVQGESLPDLAELDLPEDLGLEVGKEEQVKEETAPEFKKFTEDFEKYMGISIDQFKQQQQETVQYVNQVKAEQAKVEATKLLSNEWGVEATEVASRLERVQERFNKYPEDMRKRLDSVEGAKLIWAKIEQEQSNRLNKQVPQFQRSRGNAVAQPKVLFKQSDIDKMSPEVYQRNADRILRAYQLGLVQPN